ncbi:MAG: FtsQ-type POTRA domain-containing protein [Calditrichia bacterium]
MVQRKRPAERRRFPGVALLVLVVLAVCSYGGYHLVEYLITESEIFRMQFVQVENNQYLEQNEIIRLAGVQPGTRLFQIPKDSVEQNILRNPYLDGVSVSRSLPSTLILSVQEKQPAAWLVDRHFYMVDASGAVLLKKPAMSLQNVPLITGLSVKQIEKDSAPLQQALLLIRQIQSVDPALFQFISEIHIPEKTGRSVQTPELLLVKGGARITMKNGHWHRQAFLLSSLIARTPLLEQLDQIKKIDLQYADRVVITRKN